MNPRSGKRIASGAILIAGLVLGPGVAGADIVNTTGAVTVVAPPPSLWRGQCVSATEIRAIQEQSRFVLSANVSVQITTPGTYQWGASPGIVASGTAVQVYFFHQDTPGSAITTLTGSVTFDAPILGIITSDMGLDATDELLGVPDTSYNTGESWRGTFDTSPQDQIRVSTDLRTVTFDAYRTGVAVDQVRVITEVARLGDLNCDGAFNGADIDPFFHALGDPAAYAALFPNCDIMLGDMNGDGSLNGADIDPFFECLGTGGCP